MSYDDEFHEIGVRALAAYLDITPERAALALEHVWEATKSVKGRYAHMSFEPDPRNPGVDLAYRVEQAIQAKVTKRDMECCVVVLQEARTRAVALAVMDLPAGEAEFLLRLGIGVLRRGLRQGA